MFFLTFLYQNIFLNILLPARFHQNCQAALAAVSINGLRFSDISHVYFNATTPLVCLVSVSSNRVCVWSPE